MHNTLRLPIALLLFALAVPASAQQAESPTSPDQEVPQTTKPTTPEVEEPSVEKKVVFLLSGYEYFPSRADLDAVAGADEISALLRGFALDEDLRPSLRLRAVDALGYYDDDETTKLLVELSTTAPKADLPRRKLRTAGLLRHHAITALARSKKAESVSVLESIFAEDEVQLTLTVVHALGKHGGKEGREALRRLSSQSDHKIVQREAAKWVK